MAKIKTSLKLGLMALCIACTISTLRVEASTIGPLTTTTPISFTLSDWTSSLTFQQFNPSFGTLQSVQINLSASMQTIITVTNDSETSSSSGTARTEVMVTVQDGGNNLTAPEIDFLSPLFSYSLAPGAATTSGLLTTTATSSDTYALLAILSEFTGTGSIQLPALTFTQTLLANTGGNTTSSQATDASLTGTVLYTYDESSPVPEPGTLALFGIGVLGLLAYGRARRRSA